MDVILSRVGVSDAQLRQHCEAAVLDELQRADGRVQDAVAALQQALKVARASRELHQSLVLNASEQVQTSFRRLGASCNQIGPLLRLLHRDMGSEQPAAAAVAAVTVTQATEAATAAAAPAVSAPEPPETKPAAPQSSDASTASEYELSSEGDEADDDEPEVVEVTPPSSSKKRKAATLDLSRSPPPAARRKTLKEDTHTVRNYLAHRLEEVQALPADGYSVATHNELATYVRKVFAASADTLDDWQPRDDPTLARLLDEMEKRMGAFKESVAQLKRCKAISDWRKEMTASAFVPSLDLVSMPPKTDVGVVPTSAGCGSPAELKALAKFGIQTWSKLRVDTSSQDEQRQKYFQPLLEATTKFYEALAATSCRAVKPGGASQCNHNLRMLSRLCDGASITSTKCAQLEKLLYYVRLAMHKHAELRIKAIKLVYDLLKLFPPSKRPDFGYP